MGAIGWIGSAFAAVGGVAVYLWFFGPEESNFETSVHVDADPNRTFGMFTDFARWKGFWDISEVAPPEPPVGVGSRFTFNEKSGALVEVEITEWEPGTVFRADLDFTEADLSQAFSMLFDPEDDGCRVTMVNHGKLGKTVYKILMPGMKPFVKKYYSNVLGRLKLATESVS